MSQLEQDFKYFVDSHSALVREHNGKWVVIKGQKVLGSYGDQSEAIEATTKAGHALGTFIVQLVTPGREAFTQTFHSRVAFR